MRTKALCQVCLDNYSDENFCFGRCCGVPMVTIPLNGWYEIRNSDKETIRKFIATYGKKIGK